MGMFLREDCWWGGYLMWGGLKEEDNETFNRNLTELNWFVSSVLFAVETPPLQGIGRSRVLFCFPVSS